MLQPHILGKGVTGGFDSGSSSNSYSPRVKIDFPRFDGSNPLDWIFNAEQYFSFYETSDGQKLVLASVHFDGDVVPWYQMLHRSHQLPTWNALTRAIEEQYGPTQFDNPRAQLFKLGQTTSVVQYHTAFMTLTNRVMGLSDEALMDCFVSGLKVEIRKEVLAREPNTLNRAVALAKLFDTIGPSLAKTRSASFSG